MGHCTRCSRLGEPYRIVARLLLHPILACAAASRSTGSISGNAIRTVSPDIRSQWTVRLNSRFGWGRDLQCVLLHSLDQGPDRVTQRTHQQGDEHNRTRRSRAAPGRIAASAGHPREGWAPPTMFPIVSAVRLAANPVNVRLGDIASVACAVSHRGARGVTEPSKPSAANPSSRCGPHLGWEERSNATMNHQVCQ